MAATQSDERAELERVLSRLASIEDESRLEIVLGNLVPKLIERLETTSADDGSGAKQLLVEIFDHITKWVRPPSKVALPIRGIAEVIKLKSSKDSQSLRVGMLLIDIGFERAPVDERIECVSLLLDATSKLGDTEHLLVKFLMPLATSLSKVNLHKHREYLADLALDCCYPLNFFLVGSPRGSRLQSPNRPKTLDESSVRSREALGLLLNVSEQNDSLSPLALAGGLVAASTAIRDDVKNLAEEMVRRKRELVKGNETIFVNMLADLFLGAPTRQKAPLAARVRVLDLLGRITFTDQTREKLVKVIISGLYGTDQTVQVRIATLRLISEVASTFPFQTQAELFVSNALKQLVVSPVDQLTDDHRATLFLAFARWTASRDQLKVQLLCTVDVALKIVHSMQREHNVDAIDAEYSCLCVVGDSLESADDLAALLSSSILLDACEFPGGGISHAKLKMFATSIARRFVKSNSISENGQLMTALWILCLAARPTEPKASRDAAKHELAESAEIVSVSLQDIVSYVAHRETEWQREHREFPKHWFFPSVLYLCQSKTVLGRACQESLVRDFVSRRLVEAMLYEDDESRSLSCRSLALLLSLGKTSWDEIDGFFKERLNSPVMGLVAWALKQLASSSDSVRNSVASLFAFLPSNDAEAIQTAASHVINRLGQFHGLTFPEIHGALCVTGVLDEPKLEEALGRWIVDKANFVNNENRELRREAFASLTKILLRKLGNASIGQTVEQRVGLDMGSLVTKACEALKGKSGGGEDAMESVIGFLGICATRLNDQNAFAALIGLTTDSRFGFASQQAIGRSLGDLDGDKLCLVIDDVLTKSVFGESSQKARQSSAVLLEQLIKHGSNVYNRPGITISLCVGLVELLAEPDELSRMCACRALFELSTRVDIDMREKITRELMRKLEIAHAVANAPLATPPPTTTPNNPGNARGTSDVPGEEESARRPRLGIRAGAEERLWGFQDIASACTQSGIAGLTFPLLGVVGSVASAENREVLLRAKASLEQILANAPSMIRLAVQFVRRRHLPLDVPSRVASEAVYELSLKSKRVFDSQVICSAMWTECAQLLRDSFYAKVRRSACLTLSEIATKFPDVPDGFPSGSMESAWQSVFRALDDLDESIATGAAMALGRGIKRRTLISFKADSTGDSNLLTFLLESGLSHPAKPARDLTRAFFVDAITKLPVVFVSRIVDALIRTVGESESVALQYAQFHARGGAGTGELGVDAKQLEQLRARIALESPEYRASVQLVTRLSGASLLLSVARDLVQAVARQIRVGVGFATLTCAIDMAGFLASDEWTPSATVLDAENAGVLLTAITVKTPAEHSIDLVRRLGVSGALVARAIERTSSITAPEYVGRYCRVIASEYEGDAETSSERRRLAAMACGELVKRNVQSLDHSLIRCAYLGQFDEDPDVASQWVLALEAGLRTQVNLLAICAEGLASQTYRARRQAAQCLLKLATKHDLERASESQLGQDLVRICCSSADWEGKDLVVKSTGVVFEACKEPDLVAFAVNGLVDAVVNADAKRPKWLLEALLNAIRVMLTSTILSDQVRSTVAHDLMNGFDTYSADEPLIVASYLRSIAGGFPSVMVSGGVVDLDKKMDKAITLVEAVLNKSPTWNVRVACFELVTKVASRLANSVSLLNKLATTLKEERKPTVLLAALACTAALNTSSTLVTPSVLAFLNEIKPELVRLEKSSDVAVGKAAHDILIAQSGAKRV